MIVRHSLSTQLLFFFVIWALKFFHVSSQPGPVSSSDGSRATQHTHSPFSSALSADPFFSGGEGDKGTFPFVFFVGVWHRQFIAFTLLVVFFLSFFPPFSRPFTLLVVSSGSGSKLKLSVLCSFLLPFVFFGVYLYYTCYIYVSCISGLFIPVVLYFFFGCLRFPFLTRTVVRLFVPENFENKK